jgi:EAL domain-containing protein (putative c-di-GMP-specific phosphodiesterase class I)
LSYLPSLPFGAVKIDRSFVNELMTRPESSSFVQSIVTMAHNLKMRVIVEGIETEAELKHLASLGADEAQGYWLGRPSPDPMAYIRGMKQVAEAGLDRVISGVEVTS